MRKLTKNVVSVILAAAMVMSMASCGQTKTEAPAATTQQTTSTATTTEVASTEAAPAEDIDYAWEKYNDVVTITQAHPLQAGVVYPEGDTQTDNEWTRYALEKFNIKLEDAWAAESDYTDKIQLAMLNPDDPSAGLPDIFRCTSTQLKQLVEYGLVADLTDVFDKYASDRLKELEYGDMDSFNAAVYDGKLYGLSTQHYGYISSICQIWVRQDWLDNLGLAQPKTWDDLYEVCKQFTLNDPDGNGKNDTVGLVLYKDESYFKYMFNGFHAYPNIWIEKDGQTVYGGIQPECKDALAYFQKMYADGYINKEFATLDKSGMKEYIESGKGGVCLYTGSFGYSIGMNSYANDENAMFYCMEIPSIDNDPTLHGFNLAGSTFNVVNANCKNPEAAIKLANIYAWVYNDLVDQDVKAKFDYTYGNPGPFGVNNPLADYKQAVDISIAQDTRDTSELRGDAITKYNGLLLWLDDHNYEGLPYYYQCSKDGALKKCQHVIDNHEYIIDRYHNVPGDEYTKYMSTLNTMRVETFTKIIMGESLDTFDKYVEDWKAAGGDAVTAEMNAK